MWTYVDTLVTVRDQLRFLVGDNDPADQLVSDGEVAWASSQDANIYLAAVTLCQAIAAKFARQADTAIGDVKVSLSQRAIAYKARAAELMIAAAQSVPGIPYAGGISVGDKTGNEQDSDRLVPSFTRRAGDDPVIAATDGAAWTFGYWPSS